MRSFYPRFHYIIINGMRNVHCQIDVLSLESPFLVTTTINSKRQKYFYHHRIWYMSEILYNIHKMFKCTLKYILYIKKKKSELFIEPEWDGFAYFVLNYVNSVHLCNNDGFLLCVVDDMFFCLLSIRWVWYTLLESQTISLYEHKLIKSKNIDFHFHTDKSSVMTKTMGKIINTNF